MKFYATTDIDPPLYLSRYTEDGTLRYTVIYRGCALMASTVDPAKALAFLADTARKSGIEAPMLYDGDACQFAPL